MATTTTNFGWTIPQSTDLVKDGATAIATLGSGIDTSMADLKGGTTGQVLKKNSNTDMDFVWSADSAGMTNPMTTTGDTIYSSSGSTPARLGIGSTGQVLTVSGGIPTWATPASGSMTLLSTTSLAGVSTVTISSISQDYNHLQILIEDFDFNANDKAPALRINGDTGSNYAGNLSSISNNNSFSTFWDFFSGSDTNNGNVVIADIPFYSNSSIFKCVTANATFISSTGAGYYRAGGYFGSHIGTPAAITSITVFNRTDSTNFDAGSVKIYGVK